MQQQDQQNRADIFYDSDSNEASPFEKVIKEKPVQQPVPDSPEPTEIDIDGEWDYLECTCMYMHRM